MKKILLLTLSFCFILKLSAENSISDLPLDTVRSLYLNEVIISTSSKETNDLKTLPSSVSIITPFAIEGRKITNIKDLSSIIPNFFIPDYGSKLSVPVYIRGIGERSTGHSVGMYVDNTPYLDKSVFDFEFMDISQIEVLRGPQGTLYGRNAMSGVINIKTNSPLHSQYGKISLTTGNYGLFRIKAAASELLKENIGIAISGYYDGNNGYFTNKYSGNKADKLKSAGTRFRFDWRINPHWNIQFSGNYDIVEQGAFPYGLYSNETITDPDYNSPGSYSRQVAGGSLNLQYKNHSVLVNSNTGFIYFDDNMKMDLDYSRANQFRINQLQNERSWTEELTIKSVSKNNYQWSFGVFGFYNDLKTDVVTTMERDGIDENIVRYINEYMPPILTLTVDDESIPMPGKFLTPSYGGAIFHQSTYNNLLTEGLSVTAGLRVDYEKAKLNYNTNAGMNMSLKVPGPTPPFSIPVDSILQGERNTSFKEVLPKISIKYEIDPKRYVYATVSNGYKTGGYNIQNFADIARNALTQKSMSALFEMMPPSIPKPNIDFPSISIDSVVPYKPEYSWNYEIGFKGEVIKNYLFAEIAAYYINVKDIQITDFVESGQGRILKNAGKARSIGFDISLSTFITNELSFSANWGFTQATFQDYKVKEKDGDNSELIEIDYSGNHIPFAPQNTLSFSGVFNKALSNNQWIDRFHIQAQYNVAGKIYWTEKNDIYQNLYGLLNVRAGINKGILGVNLWANNILNTEYTAFYFESLGQSLAQKGKPFTCGIDINLSF
ncbi:TonB-dependent receptor [Bacteroidales bacterium OttesenSCG-928-M06]|nr:TonB-dependent receptor [Bacteroidales bacterium OttesenSCG-928-M06]